MSRMTSGRIRFRYSLQPSYCGPPKSAADRFLDWIIVPIAPSKTRTPPLECLAKKRSALGRTSCRHLSIAGRAEPRPADLLLHYAAMAADGPKSAFELAMERLRLKDKEAGVDEHPLTERAEGRDRRGPPGRIRGAGGRARDPALRHALRKATSHAGSRAPERGAPPRQGPPGHRSRPEDGRSPARRARLTAARVARHLPRPALARHRAFRGVRHQRGVLGEDAGGVARLRRLPLGEALLDLAPPGPPCRAAAS